MAPSKEVAEKFIKKRAIGRFVKRVVSVGHRSPDCVMSDVGDQPGVSDRPCSNVIPWCRIDSMAT